MPTLANISIIHHSKIRKGTHSCVWRTSDASKTSTCGKQSGYKPAEFTHTFNGQEVKKNVYLPVSAQACESASRSNSSPIGIPHRLEDEAAQSLVTQGAREYCKVAHPSSV